MDNKAVELNNLLLDPQNPRFGGRGEHAGQVEILDYIVQTFTVDDVISSIAVNGYFAAEPMVCKPLPDSEGKYVVVEGNRRLAACLILIGDQRAKNHSQRTAQYQKIHNEHGSPSFDPVPVIIISEGGDRDLLSYLGVRHIASSQPWDSFAKAVWISGAVNHHGFTIDAVADMIGDKHRTVERLLEGYNFINQLIENNKFSPENSQRRGRGSNSSYPFSWVYTLLGYQAVREFLDLQGGSQLPVPEQKLDDAKLVVDSMFGNKSIGRDSQLDDSRQLSLLANIVSDREKLSLLRSGKKVNVIQVLTQPLEEHIYSGMESIREIVRELNTRVTEEDVEDTSLTQIYKVVDKTERQFQALVRELRVRKEA